MLIKRNEESAANYGIFDASGQQIPFVQSYDTETKEIEMYVKISDDEFEGEERYVYLIRDKDGPFLAKFILPGSYAMDKDGKIIE